MKAWAALRGSSWRYVRTQRSPRRISNAINQQKASLSWRALRLVLEDDFDIFEKLKDKFDPNEIVKVKEEMLKTGVETTQATDSATVTPNPPPTAMFAAESDGEVKDIKAEVGQSMPASDTDVPMESGVTAETEKPFVQEPRTEGASAGSAGNDASATAQETLNDVEMK
jgi:hypothetical protein